MNITEFLTRCDVYCAARQPPISRARLSTILFNDGKRLDAIASGSDVGHRRLSQAVLDLSRLEAALASQADEAA